LARSILGVLPSLLLPELDNKLLIFALTKLLEGTGGGRAWERAKSTLHICQIYLTPLIWLIVHPPLILLNIAPALAQSLFSILLETKPLPAGRVDKIFPQDRAQRAFRLGALRLQLNDFVQRVLGESHLPQGILIRAR